MTMQEFEKIIQECKALGTLNPDFEDALGRIENQLRDEKFTACIVGSFSHGKTRLLNNLLDTDVFPENALPSTTVLTEVRYGPNKTLVFIGASRQREYELSSANLQLFCAGEKHEDEDGVLAIEYPAKFLKPSVKLVDTPGLDDLLTVRANLTFATLQRSDAAIVAVSALSPLSQNEKTFIETYLFERAMPKLAIVVTFLDQLSEEHSNRVLQYLKTIISQNWPQAELWSAIKVSGNNSALLSANGVDEIREKIMSWSIDPDLLAMRLRKAALSLQNNLMMCLRESEILLSNLHGDREARKQKLQEDMDALSAKCEKWQALRQEFLHSGLLMAKELQQTISGRAEKIYNMALSDSRQTFEASLRLNLQQVVAETSQDLQRKMREDVDMLLGHIRSVYGFEPVIRKDMLKIQPDFSTIALPSRYKASEILDHLKGLDKDLVDKIVIFLPVPPIARPILRHIAHWLLDLGKTLLESDPQSHRDEIRAEINKFLTALTAQIMALVDTLYGHIADEIRQEQDNWLKEQKNFLQYSNIDNVAENKIATLSHKIANIRKILNKLGRE